ncbi:MAG TPA: hypothetical protein VFP80_17385, partial [Thermoanaerobaculia bacterium]|nr:hypothetical protein [Thermoanaerobaculia bacterium]
TTAPESHTAERESHTVWSGRLEAIDVFLTLFAKAIRQVHAYPVTSQVCVDAIHACRVHLASLDGADEIRFTVTPDALLVYEKPVGDNQFVRHELVRRLRRARVAALTVQRDCTARDLTRSCINILRCSETTDRTLSVAEFLAEDGVEAVSVELTSRREVLQVAPSAPTQRDLVAHERRRREEAHHDTRTVNLFPPHRGWIRLDPAESYDWVSLADLAILVDDPNDLAGMLDRLAEDTQAHVDADPQALDRRFSNVSALFAGLEPRLSRVMFAKLGRVIVDMDADRKHGLLKGTILPAIFDGRPEMQVLHTLSDADLAEALCLLFDPENGGSALAISALDQLKLAPERRATLLPLMEELMRARIDPALGLDATTAIALDQQARRLTRVSAAERRSFVELAGFDLRVDDQARTTIDSVRAGIRDTDGTMAELLCLINLVGLQPNPEVAAAFVHGALERASQLVAATRWNDLASALDHLARVVGSQRERRPEITALVDTELAAFATTEFAGALLAQHSQGEASQAISLRLIDALGPAIAPSLLTLLETDARAASVAVGLMCERALLFAQPIADGIPTYSSHVRAHVARVLGFAGPGFENALGSLCSAKDERATREALRGLSRIGTARAAELVGVLARGARDWMSSATVETMLRFPPEIGAPAIRDLLAERSFVLAQPAATSRLIARVA